MKLLKSKDEDSRIASSGAIMNLADNATLRGPIIKAGAIPPLVDILREEGVLFERKLDCETALCTLALDPAADKDMTKDDLIIRVLIEIVTLGSPKGRELASLGIENLALYQAANRVIIKDLQGLPPLVTLVRNADKKYPDSARRAGSRAIGAVGMQETNRPFIAEAKGLEVMGGFMTEGTDLPNRIATADALGVCCTYVEANQKATAAIKGVPEALLSMLQPLMAEGEGGKGSKGKPAKKEAKKGKEKEETPAEEAADTEDQGPTFSPEEVAAHDQGLRAACMMVAALVEMNESVADSIVKAGFVPSLLAVMHEASPVARGAASLAIAGLARHASTHKVLLDSNAPEAIYAVLKHCSGGFSGPAESAARAATHLATTGDPLARAVNPDKNGQEALLAANVMSGLALLLRDGDVSARNAATGAVRSLCIDNDHGRDMLVANDAAMGHIVDLLRQRPIDVPPATLLLSQEIASAAIMDVVLDHQDNLRAATKADAVEPLVDVLITSSERGKEHAACALLNLAALPSNVRRIINAGAVEPMVTMLQSEFTRTEGRCAAAGALGYLATNSKATQILIAVIGALKPMIALMEGEDLKSAKAAALALANLARDQYPIQRDIAELSGVEAAVVLLGGPPTLPEVDVEPPATVDYSRVPPEGREAAAKALESICDLNYEVQMHASAVGALPPLVDLLKSTLETAKEWAARAVAAVGQYPPNVVSMAELGVVPLLVALAGSTAEASNDAACLAIENCAVADPAVRTMLEEGGVTAPVVKVLGSRGMATRTRAARALTVLASTSSLKQDAVAKGAIAGLTQLLQMAANDSEQDHDDVKEAAARTITQLAAREPSGIDAVAAAKDCVSLLVANLQSKHVQVQDSASLALWAVAGHAKIKQSLVDSGAMDILVRVVGQGAITRMTKGDTKEGRLQRSEVEHAAHVEREVTLAVLGLVDLLCQGTDGGKKDAAWGLVNLSRTHPNRLAVAHAGAVPLLVNVIVYGTPRSQAAAVWALWCLSRTPGSRSMLARKEYLVIVSQLLNNGSASARIATCGCLADLAEGDLANLDLIEDCHAIEPLGQLLCGKGIPTPPPRNLIYELAALRLPGCWAHVAERDVSPGPEDRMRFSTAIGRRWESLVESAALAQKELEAEAGLIYGENPVQDSAVWALARMHDVEVGRSAGRDPRLPNAGVLTTVSTDESLRACVLILTQGSYHGRRGVACLLGSMAVRGADIQNKVADAGALEALSALLTDPLAPAVAVQAAARALSSISVHQPKLLARLFESDIISTIVSSVYPLSETSPILDESTRHGGGSWSRGGKDGAHTILYLYQRIVTAMDTFVHDRGIRMIYGGKETSWRSGGGVVRPERAASPLFLLPPWIPSEPFIAFHSSIRLHR